jgi:hypothetical protein
MVLSFLMDGFVKHIPILPCEASDGIGKVGPWR